MLTAAQLLQRFDVFGRFYERDLGGMRLRLRSHLEIVAREFDDARRRLDASADLVAVMMNPGASRPLEAPDAEGWARAVPDRTQYQLMRLAFAAQSHGLRMRHIRVINLSDLHAPKSAELFGLLVALGELGEEGAAHSIFSASRQVELRRALGRSSTPVLRAWGLAPQLRPLAAQAVVATCDSKVLGLTDNGLAYRHPLPQRFDLQQRWLADATRQLLTMAPLQATAPSVI